MTKFAKIASSVAATPRPDTASLRRLNDEDEPDTTQRQSTTPFGGIRPPSDAAMRGGLNLAAFLSCSREGARLTAAFCSSNLGVSAKPTCVYKESSMMSRRSEGNGPAF
jgi:hypothetical protein